MAHNLLHALLLAHTALYPRVETILGQQGDKYALDVYSYEFWGVVSVPRHHAFYFTR